MDKIEAIAKGEKAQYATSGDETVLGQLMQQADKSLKKIDYSSKEATKTSTTRMIDFMKNANQLDNLPSDETVLIETIQSTMLANRETTSPAQVVKLLAIQFEKLIKENKNAARGTKTYIDCPFTDKDEVKALGARWDNDEKKWYVPGDKDISQFAKWIK